MSEISAYDLLDESAFAVAFYMGIESPIVSNSTGGWLGEGFGESDPAHSILLNAATSGLPPAGAAHKRKPVLMLSDSDSSPEQKGYLCAQLGAFNLHAARSCRR